MTTINPNWLRENLPERKAYLNEYLPQACCDTCGQRRELTVSVSFGITVWACAECRKRRQWL